MSEPTNADGGVAIPIVCNVCGREYAWRLGDEPVCPPCPRCGGDQGGAEPAPLEDAEDD